MDSKVADAELAEYVNIDQVDPQFQFHLPKPVKCEPARINPAEIAGCTAKSNLEDVPTLLIMSDGGTDLGAFKQWEMIDKSAFLLEVIRLFKGVELFVKNGYVHYDIKLNNIVLKVAPDGMRLNYIDFGEMKTLEWVKTPDDNALGIWVYFPIDYHIIKRDVWSATFGDVINYISTITGVPRQTIINEWTDFTKNYRKKSKKVDLYNRIASRFDSYQLGLALIQLLPRLKLQMPLHNALFSLFYRMMHPHLMKRLWIEDATREYEEILNKFILNTSSISGVAAAVVKDLEQIPDSRGNSPKYDKLEPLDISVGSASVVSGGTRKKPQRGVRRTRKHKDQHFRRRIYK